MNERDNIPMKSPKAILKIQQELALNRFKTLYRGSSKMFGMFYCFDCKKGWASPHSWCDMGQQCKTCKKNIYPYEQTQLVRSERDETRPPHITELCQKCKSLGRNCSR